MAENFDYYDKQALDKKLRDFGYDLEYAEVMKSTMNFSPKKSSKRPFLVLANHQTDGRGRYNNRWNDEKNKSVLMTIVEKDSFISRIPVNLLSHLAALQVCLVLKKITKSREIKIKWPNDIMLSGRKIAGILVERKKGVTYIGVGINVYKNKTVDSAYLLKKDAKAGRQKVLLDVMEKWSELKKEIASGSFEKKLNYYNKLWKRNSFILNKKVFMSLKDFVVIGTVKESFLSGDIIVESNNKMISVSENDYVPGSCVIR